MPNTVTSPNMGIVVPVVSEDPGPDWATNIYNALNATIDAHDHSSGKGVKITPLGLNINADLPYASNNATALRTTRFTSQASALVLGTDVGCLYNVNGDAFWNNGAGTAIQLTKSGAVNAAITTYSLKSIGAGTTTILATDQFSEYFADTTSGTVTINLPASSSLAVGRFYYVSDYKANANVNAISVVPNGTDKINGLNATYAIGTAGATIQFATDALGNWSAQTTLFPYLVAAGQTYGETQSPLITIATATSDHATHALTVANQAPFASATVNKSASNIILELKPSLAGAPQAIVKIQDDGAGSANWMFGPQSTGGGFACIWAGTVTPVSTNYIFASDGSSLFCQATGAGALFFQSNTSFALSTVTSISMAPGTGLDISSPGLRLLNIVQHTITTDYTVDTGASDAVINCNFAAPHTVTLPAPTQGRTVRISDASGTANTNNITLARHGTETINGIAASRVLATNWGSWIVYSPDGTNWVVYS